MANEIQVRHTTGADVFARVWNAVGQVWNRIGDAFETYSTVQNALGRYAVALTEQGTASGVYLGSIPGGVPAGVLDFDAYEGDPDAPDEATDQLVGVETGFEWDGSARLDTPAAAEKLLAAVYDTATANAGTGVITLSNGATQAITAAGRTTTEPP